MTQPLQLDRLLRLADFLDTVPAEKFDYAHWFYSDGHVNKLALGACGTTACALGWATAIPEFQALGLRLRPSGISALFDGSVYCEHPNAPESQYAPWESACFAAKHVFGLNEKQTLWLFTPSEDHYENVDHYGDDGKPLPDAPPSLVAEHIREFVAHHLDGNEDGSVP